CPRRPLSRWPLHPSLRRGRTGARSIARHVTQLRDCQPLFLPILNSYRPADRSQLKLCQEYNDYKYGLYDRNGYLNALSDEQIRQQYASRRVTYLLGSADIHQDENLENNCAACAQTLWNRTVNSRPRSATSLAPSS